MARLIILLEWTVVVLGLLISLGFSIALVTDTLFGSKFTVSELHSALAILLGLVMIIIGRSRWFSKYLDKRTGPYKARRVSGALGEIGDLDFHTPPTADAPTNLFDSKPNADVQTNGSESDYKNPFDF